MRDFQNVIHNFAAEFGADKGEEAFWTGNPRLGGLYVLHKGAMLRVSVGGNDPKAKKLRRLTTLARLALRRM